eukprot:TRINITY_DN5203_c0_g2_i1.p1 TRINITY_DN5203_c0_g2~~TRINITY_DN5203_c0_g2_i1.p1  ORF type:complete len:349 (+),score=39.58 TRINITY_DN5203_c0_g2_i1:157-1203(+)
MRSPRRQAGRAIRTTLLLLTLAWSDAIAIEVDTLCDNTKCQSFGSDCCAPGREEASCSDGYYSIRVGEGCHSQADGLYTCCNTPFAEPQYWDSTYGPGEALEGFYLTLAFFLGCIWSISLCFFCTCCKSRQCKGPAWLCLPINFGVVPAFHVGLSGAMSESEQHGTLYLLGGIGTLIGLMFASWFFCSVLPKRARPQPACKRSECGFQAHPFMEHGFCCNECQLSGGHEYRCHKKSAQTTSPAALQVSCPPQGSGESPVVVVGAPVVEAHVVEASLVVAPVACTVQKARLPLSEMVAALKLDLGVEGATLGDAVDAACEQLDVPKTGSVMQKAVLCWDKVYGDNKPSE